MNYIVLKKNTNADENELNCWDIVGIQEALESPEEAIRRSYQGAGYYIVAAFDAEGEVEVLTGEPVIEVSKPFPRSS